MYHYNTTMPQPLLMSRLQIYERLFVERAQGIRLVKADNRVVRLDFLQRTQHGSLVPREGPCGLFLLIVYLWQREGV